MKAGNIVSKVEIVELNKNATKQKNGAKFGWLDVVGFFALAFFVLNTFASGSFKEWVVTILLGFMGFAGIVVSFVCNNAWPIFCGLFAMVGFYKVTSFFEEMKKDIKILRKTIARQNVIINCLRYSNRGYSSFWTAKIF